MIRNTMTALLGAALSVAAQPRAVVLQPGTAEVARQGTESFLRRVAGDLLFDGDVIRTGDQPMQIVHCGAKAALLTPAGSSAIVVAEGLRAGGQAVAPQRPLDECTLPDVPRSLPAVQADVAGSGRPASGGQVRGGAPAAPEVLLARAAGFEHAQNWEAAVEAYRQLETAWPDTDWVRYNRRKAEDRVEEERRKGESGPPQTYAVIVGVSAISPLSEMQPLRFAHADAALFRRFLETPRGGSVPEKNIVFLTNAAATRTQIMDALRDVLTRKVRPKDRVILFFAGHGYSHPDTDPQKGRFYFLPFDANRAVLPMTAIGFDELAALLRSNLSRAETVLLFIDSCHAGAIAEQVPRRDAVNDEVRRLPGNTQALFGLVASQKKEQSREFAELGGGQGAFSWSLVLGLNGQADADNDQRVTRDEVEHFVDERVRQYTARRQRPLWFGNMDIDTDLTRLDVPGLTDLEESAPGEAGSRGSGDAGRVAAEAGEEVVLKYLHGEAIPLTRGDFEQAALDFEEALRFDPDSSWLRARRSFCLGRVAVFERDFDRALPDLERAVRLDPQGAYAFNALGIAYLEKADYERAAAGFRDALRFAPRWSYAWHNLALTHAQQGRYEEAIREYRWAMRLDPGVSYLPHNLGILYQNLNRRQEAAVSYRRAIELAPRDAAPRNALGTLRAAEGKRKQAEQLFRAALGLDARDPTARQNLAVLLWKDRRRQQEAYALWRENLALSPDFVPSRMSLAQALEADGDWAGAAGQYREVLQRHPGVPAASEGLRRSEKAQAGGPPAGRK